MSTVFANLRDKSGLAPTPERLWQRSEPSLRASRRRQGDTAAVELMDFGTALEFDPAAVLRRVAKAAKR